MLNALNMENIVSVTKKTTSLVVIVLSTNSFDKGSSCPRIFLQNIKTFHLECLLYSEYNKMNSSIIFSWKNYLGDTFHEYCLNNCILIVL